MACVAVSVGASACGDDDSDDEAGTPTTQQEGTVTEQAPSAKKTRPGATVEIGQTAHVTFKPLTPITSKKTYKLDAAVLEIEKGSIDDLEDVNLDAAQKKSTPYYVTVRVTNPGGAVPVKDDPDVRFDGIDDRGQEQPSVTFIGTFERCEDKDAPKPFTKGKSYESCLTYLVPGGGSIQEVGWSGSDEYAAKPVTWK